MRLGNPLIRDFVKDNDTSSNYNEEIQNNTTFNGIVLKAVIFCFLLLASGVLSAFFINRAISAEDTTYLGVVLLMMAFSFVPMLIISLIIRFVPKTTMVLGSIYCILNGFLIGALSRLIDILLIEGISLVSLCATGIVFLVCLLVSRFIKISNKFISFVLISLISLLMVEGFAYLLSWFIPAVRVALSNLWLQIGISSIFVLWASFVLLIDIHNIKEASDYDLEKHEEWLLAFSLVTTLIWLYMEILELVIKILAIVKRD